LNRVLQSVAVFASASPAVDAEPHSVTAENPPTKKRRVDKPSGVESTVLLSAASVVTDGAANSEQSTQPEVPRAASLRMQPSPAQSNDAANPPATVAGSSEGALDRIPRAPTLAQPSKKLASNVHIQKEVVCFRRQTAFGGVGSVSPIRVMMSSHRWKRASCPLATRPKFLRSPVSCVMLRFVSRSGSCHVGVIRQAQEAYGNTVGL
jgi:hypothetical protein